MKLIITRHGETIENSKGIMQGHMHGHLSEQGKEQARKVAERLKNEQIDFIYSSDLARTADTSKEIAKYHLKVPLIFTEELREVNLGILQGKTREESRSLSVPDLRQNIFAKPTGGESYMELYERAKKFIEYIIKKHKDSETILLAGHNGINIALTAVITGKKPEEMPSVHGMKNTAVHIFEIDKNRNHKIHVLNCTKHLE